MPSPKTELGGLEPADYREAFDLWVVYYVTTETYDRTLPGQFHGARGEWIPRGDKMVDSNRFALKVARETERALALLSISQLVSERARRAAADLSYEAQKEHAARIGG